MGNSDTGEVQFSLGQHEARLDSIEKNMGEMREDVKQILDYISRARGSWKTLVAIGTAATALSEGVHFFIDWMHRK